MLNDKDTENPPRILECCKMEDSEEDTKNIYPYKPGTIKRITLHNFMCHEKFDMPLGSRVNFIIGPNGSGKSALLTALVVVLGGRATSTSRAKKVSDFVKEGKKWAKITCVLHNYERVMDKDQAYKPDEFGKEIVVEKTIYKDETGTKLVLKDSKLRKVSERKQVLDEIVDHFNILINNPICILNQEVSKSFLHSKKPEDKFDLFMKATNLEQILNDYEEAKQSYQDWGGINTKKSLSFKLMDKEYAECKEKINFINNRLKLQARADELILEYLWATLRDFEDEAISIQEVNESLTVEKEKHQSEIINREEAISTADSDIIGLKDAINNIQTETESFKEKLNEIREKESNTRTQRININHAIEGAKSKLNRLESNRSQIEKRISTIRKEHGNQNSQVDEEARRKLEKQRLEEIVAIEKSSEQTTHGFVNQLNRSMTEVRDDLLKARTTLDDMRRDLSQKKSHLNRLIRGRESILERYGDAIVRVCAQVDAAHKAGHFKHKPRGPLGYYVKIREPQVAVALEVHLKRVAYAFAVDNNEDMSKLRKIFDRVRANIPGFRPPSILVRTFKGKHDISRFMASDPEYKTLLDHIEVEDAAVFNVLVDKASLEQQLFIADYNEAQNVMLTPGRAPRNTRCAYTKTGDAMFPKTERTGFRCIAPGRRNNTLFSASNDHHIKELEQDILNLGRQIEVAEQDFKKLERNLEVQRDEYNQSLAKHREIMDRLKKSEEQLFQLNTALPIARPQLLSDLEKDLEEMNEEIRQTRVNLEREKLKLEQIEESMSDLQHKKKIQEGKTNHKDKEIHKLEHTINEKREIISESRLAIAHMKMSIEKAERARVANQLKLDSIYQDINKAQMAVAGKDRPDSIRPSPVIRSEQKTITRQLQVDIDENQETDQLIANYRKRMDEIEKTVGLKEHNDRNYKLSEKSLMARDEGIQVLRNHTCASVGSTFASVMRAMEMEGKLSIHMTDQVVGGKVVAKARTLEMSINTAASQRPMSMSDRNGETPTTERRSQRSQPEPSAAAPQLKKARMALSPSEKENQRMTDTRSLSGGERSFSTVAFVLALWHHCASPFKLMDEIDVFMDMVTRRMSFNALIKFAEISENPGQFIYFSPMRLPEISAPKGLVKVMEMPGIARGAVSQVHSLGPAGDDNGGT